MPGTDDTPARHAQEILGLEARLQRREQLLEISRGFASEGDVELVLSGLLREAVALLGATDGAVTRWNEVRRLLVTVRRHASRAGEPASLRLGQGASGRAADRRQPVLLNDYRRECGAETRGGARGIRVALAVPMLHAGHLLGALAVYRYANSRPFDDEDARTLELLANVATATLIGLERARLEGARLAARTAQHELNNKLALTTGYAELLSLNPDLPPQLREAADQVLQGAEAAVGIVNQLQHVRRLEKRPWSPRLLPTLDLDRSTG